MTNMEFDIEDPSAEVDDSICPVCRGSTYVGETIRYLNTNQSILVNFGLA